MHSFRKKNGRVNEYILLYQKKKKRKVEWFAKGSNKKLQAHFWTQLSTLLCMLYVLNIYFFFFSEQKATHQPFKLLQQR